jgi:Auxiliary Activity family 9 (formerly GH61)
MQCSGEMIFPTNASIKAVSADTTIGFNVEGGLGHPGPLQFYMAQAPAGLNLSAWDGTGEVWFKIAGDSPKVNASGLTWPQQGESLFFLLRLCALPRAKLTQFRCDHRISKASYNSSSWKLLVARRANSTARRGSSPGCSILHPMRSTQSQRHW